MKENTKVIIIGSGLGGLSSGVILAKNGYDVTILEKGAQIVQSLKQVCISLGVPHKGKH